MQTSRALAIALYLRPQCLSGRPWGYFWRGSRAVVGAPGAPRPGKSGGGLIAWFSSKRCSLQSKPAAILSPWALVSLVAGEAPLPKQSWVGRRSGRFGCSRKRFRSDLEGTLSQYARWSGWRGLRTKRGRRPPGLEPGSVLRVLRDPHLGALQAAPLTAALPFQGRAGR